MAACGYFVLFLAVLTFSVCIVYVVYWIFVIFGSWVYLGSFTGMDLGVPCLCRRRLACVYIQYTPPFVSFSRSGLLSSHLCCRDVMRTNTSVPS